MVVALSLTIGIPLSGAVSAASAGQRDRDFTAAAKEFNVPKELLLAISYNQSRWENHAGKPSVAGGYGLMHLTTKAQVEDGRGDPSRPLPARTPSGQHATLDEAAQLLRVPADTLQNDDAQNIRGAAALLASYAKDGQGKLPSTMQGWRTAVERVGAMKDVAQTQEFADNVYTTITQGVSRTTTDGQSLSLKAQAQLPGVSNQERHRPNGGAECPPTISCRFVPAYFAQNNPNDPSDYGNIDTANRPRDMKIKYIVIHDTEGSYESAISWFQDPRSYVAAHYVIRSSDGEVTQMVKNKDVGWHAGNWYMNMHSIGIEHEGYAAEGAAWYTEAMYRSSAKLVRYLADKYDIPLDREHIIGHDQYHGLTPARVPTMHYDPGPYWDWNHYMNLLGAPTVPTAGPFSDVVTIAPRFKTNKPVVTECQEGSCVTLPKQSANFVYLRTEPNENAPLITDAGLHPGGEPGTTEISDWSAKATHGQRFVVAERRGDWIAIWFGGQKGWFYNPRSSSYTALPADAARITPKQGLSTIPVYGRPVPEPSAYTNGVPPLSLVPLQYTIPAGQAYPAYERKATNDYYHVFTFDRSSPGDGTLVVGGERYIPIAYNHRQAFVKASDVQVLQP
jgi:N-acetyl-anhydromuramyl-L-alanine amidase AmpD